MTDKEYMQQYRRATWKIRSIDADIRYLEAEIDKTAAELNGMPQGTAISDRTGALATHLADLKLWRADLRLEAVHVRKEISETIEKVTDPTSRLILLDRYILCMKWREVAADIAQDPSSTRGRLHARALDEVGKVRRGGGSASNS